MKTYALIEKGVVANVILWDGTPKWVPPPGTQAVLLDSPADAIIGDIYDGNSFHRPEAVG
jgi:hypothetical protein